MLWKSVNDPPPLLLPLVLPFLLLNCAAAAAAANAGCRHGYSRGNANVIIYYITIVWNPIIQRTKELE